MSEPATVPDPAAPALAEPTSSTVTIPSTVLTTSPPREYHHALRRPGVRPWRGVVAIVVMLVGYLAATIGFGIAAGRVDAMTGVADPQSTTPVLTPLTLLAVNLGAATLIPLSMLIQWWLFGVRPRWLSSVRGGVRWRLLLRVTAFVVPAWLVYVVVGTIIGLPGRPDSLGLNVSVPLLVVVLTTTWAQAAGEEYGFRGLVTRSVGSWCASPRVAFVVATLATNLIFMVAHLATDPWLIVYYFIFGVACSIVTWRTGGLEAGIVLHAVNNILLFVSTALFNGGEVDMDRSAGVGGEFMLVPIAMMVLAAASISWWAGRCQVDRLTDAV